MDFWKDQFATAFAAMDWATSWLPNELLIGGIAVPSRAVAEAAFGNPFTQYGALLKLATDLQRTGATKQQIQVAIAGQQDIASAAPNQTIVIGRTTSMAQLILANVYRCSIEMVTGGRQVINVVHIEGSAAGQETAAATAVLAAWKVATGPLSKLSNLVTMTGVAAMDLSSTSGGIHVIADTTTGSVSTSNSLATRGACALVKWNGGTRSRTSRGRLYYGPIMEGDINTDGATLTGTTVTALGTAFTAFRTSLSGAGFTLGVASRTASVFTSVSSQTIETTIATQRRRIRS